MKPGIEGVFQGDSIDERVMSRRNIHAMWINFRAALKLAIQLSRNIPHTVHDAASECIFELAVKCGFQFSPDQTRKFQSDEVGKLFGTCFALVWVFIIVIYQRQLKSAG